MGQCQQAWWDPETFETKTCGAETDRREGDRFVCKACADRVMGVHKAMAAKMVCPLCWGVLRLVPAREMHLAHAEHDLARKCSRPGCTFICYQGDEGPRPVPEITIGPPRGTVTVEPIPTRVDVREPDWELRGCFAQGPIDEETLITSWQQFTETFGARGQAARNAYDFFQYAVGTRLRVTRVAGEIGGEG